MKLPGDFPRLPQGCPKVVDRGDSQITRHSNYTRTVSNGKQFNNSSLIATLSLPTHHDTKHVITKSTKPDNAPTKS